MKGRSLLSMAAVAAGLFSARMPVAAQHIASGDPQGLRGADLMAKVKEEAAKPTPRLADGHPDLSGNWSDPPGPGLEVVRSADGKSLTVLDRDAPEIDARAQPGFKARAAD